MNQRVTKGPGGELTASNSPLATTVSAKQMGRGLGFVPRVAARSLSLIGIVLLIAACNGGGGASASVDGDWRGTWNSNSGPGGSVNATFVQGGNNLTGTISLSGSPCLTRGNITGTTSRTGATFGAVEGSHQISFTARNTGPTRLTGTYSVAAGRCIGDIGVFDVTKISSP